MSSTALRQLALWGQEDFRPEWTVRASPRARRLSVRVWRDGGIEVVVPLRTPPEEVAAFVARHRQWIEQQRRRSVPRPGEPFPPVRVELAATGESWSCVAWDRDAIGARTDGELALPAAAGPPRLRTLLRRWLATRALDAFEPPLAQLAARMDVSYARLQIRRQRTRWGSCSTRGTVSLNCCLLFQRPEVVRYLMVHELAHLVHMNHSARFWRQVARFEPAWRELDRELLRGWQRVPRWALG